MMASTRNMLFTLLVLPALIAQPAYSTSIIVDASGNCALVEAITSANNDSSAGNGCVDGSGEDRIILEKDVTLAAPLPEITSTVIIEGGGHFISGNIDANVGTVLRITGSGNLTLNNIVITDGRTNFNCGGISNYGAVTLNNSTVSGNRATDGGGICNAPASLLPEPSGGILTLNNSTVSGNTASQGGGGIYNYGYATAALIGSTVSGNTASLGGGIYSDGRVTLTGATVSGNTASNGGGLFNSRTLALVNSTASGNAVSESGGGIENAGGTLTLTGATVSGNTAQYYGAGIHNGFNGTVTLRSSVVSGNIGSGGNEICQYNGTITANSSNFFGHSGETSMQAFNMPMACSGFTPGSSDATATSDSIRPTALAVILSPLAVNGGPTKTHALPSGSPAIDLDTTCSTGLTTDQRGVSRPSGTGCDAGAFEFVAALPLKTNALPAIYHLLLKKK